ncbi:MAG: amino acid permease [Bifidobacteriaceae bacterium]|jgi:APA family basic amino acid/polyamine antiporter|nr:amino acid permease [Bifidobacteriaceae bacterium]
MDIFRKKSVTEQLQSMETQDQSHKLKANSLTWVNIAAIAMATAIGAGIFTIGARTIATQTGPAVILSWVIAGTICFLSTICYAELGSLVPLAGSGYNYTYTVLGEIWAWIVGANLWIEYFLAGTLVAKVWGAYYFTPFIARLTGDPDFTLTISVAGIPVDLSPLILLSVVLALIIAGVKITSLFNSVLVAIKVAIILFVIVVGIFFVKWSNFVPFIPEFVPAPVETVALAENTPFGLLLGQNVGAFGLMGVLVATPSIFYAYLGFEAAATAGEEAKDPGKNVPKGLLIGLGIITLLYIITTLVVAGMVSQAEWADLVAQGRPLSLSSAFDIRGLPWAGALIDIGAIIGLATVVLMAFYGFTRAGFAMARDGMILKFFFKTSKKRQAPVAAAVIGCGIAMILSSLFETMLIIEPLISLTWLGAFAIICFAIPVLRKRQAAEGYVPPANAIRVPGNPALPIFAGLACIWLASTAKLWVWIDYLILLAVFIIWYFGYARRHSTMNQLK